MIIFQPAKQVPSKAAKAIVEASRPLRNFLHMFRSGNNFYHWLFCFSEETLLRGEEPSICENSNKRNLALHRTTVSFQRARVRLLEGLSLLHIF